MVDPAGLVAGALERGLRLIAVCDHDTMASAAEVRARGEAAGLAVVCGEEVTTRWPAQTHVMGWFLERPVRSGMSLADTVDAIRAQGALAIIPHPFMPTYFASCQPGMLVRLIEDRTVDGIEIEHSSPTTASRHRRLAEFYNANRERLGAAIGASDSHFGRHDLGQVLTEFDGESADDFRRAVLERRTQPRRGRPASVPVGIALRQQWRSLAVLPVRRLTGQL
jgi:predicted metal-dependent phosphoesterase TrpH